jgi:MFS family permease
MLESKTKTISLTILVASLGYFVDVYDLQLFNIVSRESIAGIGITDEALIAKYDYLLFLWQMGGMLVGGVLWGILGDLKGRKNILFGSILMYSLANLANAFVIDMTQYSLIRFVAGLGLAGELGAAVTLVSEVMTKEKRGYGTMIIVTMGAFGAVAAALISKMHFAFLGLANWQIMYIIGGILGLLLLALRMGTFESEMFDEVKKSNVEKGNFLMLFNSKQRFKKYMACIFIGLPVWYCIGVLIKFSESFSVTNAVVGEPVKVGFAIMYAYIGLSVGDLFSGLLSQLFKSRKKVVYLYLAATILITSIFLFTKNLSTETFYLLCFIVGLVTGYWALFVTMASESFGTNIRATVTTTVPNFVRGAVVPVTLSFKALETSMGNIYSAFIVGLVCFTLALVSLFFLEESFSKDLDYIEGDKTLELAMT